ncbi:MAG: helix-turn-helix transcriptional regulator [Sciscionella sp.]
MTQDVHRPAATTKRHALARARKTAGLTQERLAEVLGVERSTVVRWEAGTSEPQPWLWPKLGRALGVSRTQLAPLLVSVTPPTAASIEELRDAVTELGMEYDRAPSTALLAAAGSHLAQIASIRDRAADGTERELGSIEAEAATLMGQLVWDASQRRDHRTANVYYKRAIEASRRFGDPAPEADALLRSCFVALYGEQDPLTALMMAERAVRLVSAGNDVLRGRAYLHVAEAQAMLGDERECEQALAAAARFTQPGTDGAAQPSFDRLAGSCYLSLGRYVPASAALERATTGLRDRPKSRAIALGNLALVHIRQSRLDGAVSTLHEAIDVVERTRGGGGMSVIFRAGRELGCWRSEPAVRIVQDRMFALVAAG